MRTVALRSLGCKVNAYETEGIQQKLEKIGYIIVPFDSKADVYIVNTCSVTNIADHKSRQMLHRAKKLNPDAVVVAIGCYVETGRDVLEKDPEVDLVIGNDKKMDLPQILARLDHGDGSFDQSAPWLIDHHLNYQIDQKNRPHDQVDQKNRPHDQVDQKNRPRDQVRTRTRAFIKIQDGCNRFCTYCVIPYARGRVRSREMNDVVSEVRALADGGCREIVLTGIHISSFGTDRGEPEMIPLLRQLNEVSGLRRIRLGSLEPAYVTPEWVEGARGIDKLCPHFHLSMQSGSETVLKRMNRHYTPEEYYEKVCMLREAFGDPAFTTDVIVGFPGETPEEFAETYDFVQKAGFFELHVFKYSRRDGTPAAGMPGQVPEREKHARSEKLIALGRELSMDYRKRRLGTQTEILTEEIREAGGVRYMCGHTPEYAFAGIHAESAEDEQSNVLIGGTLEGFADEDLMVLKLSR